MAGPPSALTAAAASGVIERARTAPSPPRTAEPTNPPVSAQAYQPLPLIP